MCTCVCYNINKILFLQFFANLGKNVIAHCNEITVKEMLGEGSYAQVFKVDLRKERKSGCVSNILYKYISVVIWRTTAWNL